MTPNQSGSWRRVGGLALALLLSIVLPISAVMSAAPAQQDDATPLIVAFYGPADSSAALGVQVAVQEINELGSFTGGDGQRYQLQARVTQNPADLLEAAFVLTVPTDITAPDPITLTAPVLMVDTSADLSLPGIEAPVFRAMSPRSYLYAMLADFIGNFNAVTNLTVAGDATLFANDIEGFTTLLRGVDESIQVQVMPGATLTPDQVTEVVGFNPQLVVYWGDVAGMNGLIQALDAANWNGLVAFEGAFEARQSGELVIPEGITVIGVTSWTNSAPNLLSQQFIASYLQRTGLAPDARAVSAYDATWAMRLMIERVGADPAVLAAALPTADVINTTQGAINPSAYDGALFNAATIYELLPLGGTQILARYDAGVLVEDEDEVVSAVPSATPLPSATPNGPVVTVNVETLRVRSGPGMNYDVVANVSEGTVMPVLGTVPDFSWFYVQAPSGLGWVTAQFVTFFGPGGLQALPLAQIPASPTPAPSPTAGVAADLVIDGVVLSPARPISGQAFTATISVRNAGGTATGSFAVAATWQPGGVFASAIVEPIEPGATRSVTLTPTVTGSGSATVVVVADLNSEVTESNESNNNFSITYTVDATPVINQANQAINSSDVNLDATGPADIVWADAGASATITALPGTTLGVISGYNYADIPASLLTSSSISLGSVQAFPGETEVGFRTGSGQCGVMRVDSYAGTTITITYRVYAASNCPG